jgi:hypothetical protein
MSRPFPFFTDLNAVFPVNSATRTLFYIQII